MPIGNDSECELDADRGPSKIIAERFQNIAGSFFNACEGEDDNSMVSFALFMASFLQCCCRLLVFGDTSALS